jgi:hypothetical protein
VKSFNFHGGALFGSVPQERVGDKITAEILIDYTDPRIRDMTLTDVININVSGSVYLVDLSSMLQVKRILVRGSSVLRGDWLLLRIIAYSEEEKQYAEYEKKFSGAELQWLINSEVPLEFSIPGRIKGSALIFKWFASGRLNGSKIEKSGYLNGDFLDIVWIDEDQNSSASSDLVEHYSQE